jgi:hypothetical protein
MRAVREYGYELTFDWTSSDLWNHPDPSDAALTIAAQVDDDAVQAADILWYVTPAELSGKSEGSHYELGVARTLGRVTLASGVLGRHRIFPRLARHRFELHAEALEWLRLRAKE